MLIRLGAVRDHEGETRAAVPHLPLAPWRDYLSTLDGVGEEICRTIAEAANDLRRRAVHCSFADCNFADAVFVFFSYLQNLVKQAIDERKWTAFPDEADFTWGALIVR